LNKIVKDYEELPQKYDPIENYVLTEVVDIISYVLGRVIGANMYLALTKTLTKYVTELNPSELETIKKEKGEKLSTYGDINEYQNFIKLTVYAMMDFANNKNIQRPIPKNATLENYMVKKMPKIYVKFVLKIFKGDGNEDPHSQIVSVDRLFEPIIDTLKSTTIIHIDDNSSLIKNIKTYLIPYYNNLFNEFIPAMKVMIDNYNRFIINQGKYIEIINMLNDRMKSSA
jgi:hypothetical protein